MFSPSQSLQEAQHMILISFTFCLAVHIVFNHAYVDKMGTADIYDELPTMLSMQWGVLIAPCATSMLLVVL